MHAIKQDIWIDLILIITASTDEPKSPESKAFKLFSEGKSPVEVAIALDQPGDRVRAIYREYWELTGRYELAQIYDEAKKYLPSLLRLHKIGLRMEENDVIILLDILNTYKDFHLDSCAD